MAAKSRSNVWASSRKTSPTPALIPTVAQPRDPNRSFVHFPAVPCTGRVIRVGLESLIRQVESHLDRGVVDIRLEGNKFIIDWEVAP